MVYLLPAVSAAGGLVRFLTIERIAFTLMTTVFTLRIYTPLAQFTLGQTTAILRMASLFAAKKCN